MLIGKLCSLQQQSVTLNSYEIYRENKKDEILREADLRLKKLVTTSFKQIAFELENQDPYQYLRAYTSGMQEFIEALTFHQYLTNNTIQDWPYVVQQLTYDIPTESETNEGSDSKIVKAHLPAIEYVLGKINLIHSAVQRGVLRGQNPQILEVQRTYLTQILYLITVPSLY